MAHAFVQAFEREIDAFRAFAQDHPGDCILLVDTYDTVQGVLNAIAVAREMRASGHELRGVRLDSGDLVALSRRARELLDEDGFPDVTILASGGLDEHDIARLVADDARIDAFGVGTDLVVSVDRPALDIAYKLVAYAGRPVAKYSEGKRTFPGRKQVYRTGTPDTDVLALREEALDGEPLLQPVWRDGSALVPFDIEIARQRVADELERLPAAWRDVTAALEPPTPKLSPGLRDLSH
jgi:nicotinate phosphoribosyltransferase